MKHSDAAFGRVGRADVLSCTVVAATDLTLEL